MKKRSFLTALPLLLPWLSTPGHAQTGSGSASGTLTQRVDYYIEYETTESGSGTQYSHIFVLLTRGQPDSLRPPEDSAIANEEGRSADAAARRTSDNSVSIPFGGHWYLAVYSRDSLYVLGKTHPLAGDDSVVIAMIDRADHVGGPPMVAGLATLVAPLPAEFWTTSTDPFRRARVLIDWLGRSPQARDFVR